MKDVKVSSSGVSGSSWATRVGAARSVQSQSTIVTGVSTAACRSALLLACAPNVSGHLCFLVSAIKQRVSERENLCIKYGPFVPIVGF